MDGRVPGTRGSGEPPAADVGVGRRGEATGRGEVRRRTVPSRLVTSPEETSSVRPVDYKGEPLDAERGPGLGCFRFQVGLLVVLIVLTPLSVAWEWPVGISVAFLFVTLVLLLFAGQTVIFLLRLVAADRRDGRRRPLGSTTPTVGQLEDAEAVEATSEGVAEPSPVATTNESDGPSSVAAETESVDAPPRDESPGERGVQE